MTRSRARGAGRLLAAATTALALVLTGCGSIDEPQQPQQQSGSDVDSRAVKSGGTLRFALDADPDKLDPTVARTLVGRNVFAAICEKLYDVNDKLEVVPQLASGMPEVSQDGKTVTIKLRTGLKFADGTTMDAAAVKTSLDRHRTLEGSQRKSELASVADVTVAGQDTVTINLKEPFAPLAAILADRAGMIMSPAALSSGKDFGTAPVCVGPFKFASRIAQDRIEVVKDPNYYDAAKVKLDKLVFLAIPDDNTRFNNLRSGDIEVEYDVSVVNVEEAKGVDTMRLIMNDSLGYQGITINLGNVSGVGKDPGTLAAPYAGPLAAEAKVRRALALSIDREALNRSVFRGVYAPACGPISAAAQLSSDAAQACPKHDPAEAKKLLGEAGVTVPFKLSMVIPNSPDNRRIGEAIKSMAAEGGFDIQLEPTEFASALDLTDAGKFQSFQVGWSGRVDPDGNLAPFVTTRGSQNIAGYSNPEVDAWIKEARATQDVDKRRELYGKVVGKLQEDLPLIYLWRQKNILGVSNKVGQVKMYGDGIARFDTAGFVD
ncbi:MAG TPA: ABC transporter substrate-binding protein [Actinophytocola sp.]|uniref:ABC transporter substrate-binding protein n=1 Tax=Actinophytocola sp. TaxID=1872138 RepID=UPI002DDDB062|nr:ABC transporter substrate-binding protein [Actinophytocola sp.]HEV2778917.1 ABC transporter substrate-binding protein [Actinophytocola sp.]